MRALIVSDIHANLAAFKAVLGDPRAEHDLVICLGDLVGYGPDPDECVALARESCDVIVAGNHDLAATGRMDLSDFSNHARRAMEWTISHLSSNSRDALEKLPSTIHYENLLISHGSPADPVWGYILSLEDAVDAFSSFPDPICFFGHTHIPSAFIAPDTYPAQKRGLFAESQSKSRIDIRYGQSGETIKLRKGRFLLNPGSVGFPRDAEDAHSSDTESSACARYAIYDSETSVWEFRRVEYDLGETARRMRNEGLW